MAEIIKATDSLNEGRKKLNAIAEEMGNKDVASMPEVINAREGKVDLYSNVSNKIDKDGNGQVGWANLNQTARENISGDKVAVVGENSVNTPNLVDKSVTEKKTTFIHESTNLYNSSSDVLRHVVDSVTGELSPSETYNLTDWVEVQPSTQYSTYGFVKVVTYDENFSRVGLKHMEDSGDTFTPGQSARFARLQYAINNQNYPRQINLGESLSSYEPYYTRLSDDITVAGSSLEANSLTTDKYVENSVTEDIVSFINTSTNLFDKGSAVVGVVRIDGTYNEESTTHSTSDFISVKPNTAYSFTKVAYIAHYDEEGQFLKRTTHPTNEEQNIQIDTATYQLRLMVNRNLTTLDDVQMNEGEELLPYEDYGSTLSENIRISGISGISGTTDLWGYSPYLIEGVTEGFYHGQEMEGFDTPYSLPKEDVYSWYDELLNDSERHSKKTIGTDGVGNPIYAYRFNAPRVEDEGEGRQEEKIPKMFLISGIHGLEKAGVYNLYNGMKAIIEDWRTDERLETLRFNADYIVVPIINPDGFDRSRRQNENDVDLARNFPERWSGGSDNPDDVTYQGPYPLSEAGSQALADLLEEHAEETILFLSHHNFGSSDGFVWIPSASKLQTDLAKKVIAKLSREWQKENEWLPQDNDWFVGRATASTSAGSETTYASSLGIQSNVLEISHTFPYEDNPVEYSSSTFTFGVEVLINWLLMNLRENVKYYNKLM